MDTQQLMKEVERLKAQVAHCEKALRSVEADTIPSMTAYWTATGALTDLREWDANQITPCVIVTRDVQADADRFRAVCAAMEKDDRAFLDRVIEYTEARTDDGEKVTAALFAAAIDYASTP